MTLPVKKSDIDIDKLINDNDEKEPDVEYRNGHIYFQDDVNQKSIDRLIQLSETHIKNNWSIYDKPNYYLHINSFGGEIYELFRYLDFLDSTIKPHCNKVVSIIEGVAMSAASLMAVSFTERYMTKRSMIMIHEIQCETGWGTLTHVNKRTDVLNKLEEICTDIYVNKTKLKVDVLKQMFLTEEYIHADKAIEYGFVDKII